MWCMVCVVCVVHVVNGVCGLCGLCGLYGAQDELNALHADGAFDLADRYATALVTTFVCVGFSPGLPMLAPIGAVTFACGYAADKYLLLRRCAMPPRYDASLARHVVGLLPYAALLHLGVALAAWSNTDLTAGRSLAHLLLHAMPSAASATDDANDAAAADDGADDDADADRDAAAAALGDDRVEALRFHFWRAAGRFFRCFFLTNTWALTALLLLLTAHLVLGATGLEVRRLGGGVVWRRRLPPPASRDRPRGACAVASAPRSALCAGR